MCGIHNVENEIIRYSIVERISEMENRPCLIEAGMCLKWTNAKRSIHSKVVYIRRKSTIRRLAIMTEIVVTLRGFGKYLSKGNRI